MNGRPEARSPFHLLSELDEAKELLILSFTANLDFFERFALSEARALGAIVTLVSDAAMVSADPVVTRRAGTSYLDARAVCPSGAFHPKLVVLAGDGEARVAVGSGNLTIAGWHGNAETWTVLRGDRSGAPETLAQVAGFLRRLAGSPIQLTPGAAEALARVADRLDEIPATESGPRLLDNLDQPIADRLPAEAARELSCSAPFFGADLAALEELIARFTPHSLAVHVQDQTSVEGSDLVDLLARHGGEIRWIEDQRYHHGKLIEWATEGRRRALTGSPNLSRSALLRSVPAGGNCELALLAEVDSSLAPPSGQPPAGGAAELSLDRDEVQARPGLLLLGAIRIPGAVRLLLHSAAEQSGRVQRYDTAADGWRRIAMLGPGESAYDIEPSSAAPGQALRIVLDDGTASNEVFVTDLARVRRPQMSAIGRVRATPRDVALEGLGTALLTDIDELREHLLRVGSLVPTAAPDDDAGSATTGDGGAGELDLPRARPAPAQTLEDYVAACDPVLGRAMTEFALVLPALPGLSSDFDESVEELDTDFEDDEETAGEDEGDDASPTLTETLSTLSDDERARWRRWVERLIDRSAGYPMVIRTLALRSVLHGIADGIWEDGQWPPILTQAVSALASPGDEATDYELAAAGSLGAIALALLRADVPRLSVRDERTLRYEAVAREIAPLLPHLDTERVQSLAAEMPETSTGLGVLDASLRVAAEVLDPPSGVEAAVRLLADEHGIEARIVGSGEIELSEPLPSYAEPQLFLAIGLTRERGPIVARGNIDNQTAILAIWKAPYLIVERRKGKRWGRMFRLPDSLSPFNYASPDAELPRPISSWMGDEPRPERASDLLHSRDPART
jgi:hypothetical protein